MPMMMPAETKLERRRRPGRGGLCAIMLGAASCAAPILLPGCGSDGNNVTCGKGTEQVGKICVAKSPEQDAAASDASDGATAAGGTPGAGGHAPVDAGTKEEGAGGATTDGGSEPIDAIDFAGVASAAPGAQTPADVPGQKTPAPDSIRLSWAPATYSTHPFATIKYDIFAATSSKNENFNAPIAEAPPGSTSFLVQGLDAKKMYFVVHAVASEGAAKDDNEVELSATPAYDDTAPSSPTGVKVESATSTSVSLSWKPGKDDSTPAEGLSYRVYWGLKSGNTPNLGAVSLPGETTATIDGLPTPETTFYFRVATVDAAGNASNNSDDHPGKTTADDTAPVFGGCTDASDPTAGGAVVSWLPATDDTTPPDDIEYEVFAFEVPVTRDTPFDKLTPVATFTGGESGEIKGLKNATTYRIVCRAVDTSGNEDGNRVTQMFTTKLDGKPPTFAGPSTDPKSYVVDSTQVSLTWAQAKDDQSPDDRISYYVYVSNKPGEEDFTAPPLVKTDPGILGTDVPELLSNTQYYFVVRAVDEAGNVDQNTNELGLVTLVSFVADVQPIFTANCALTGCHVPGNPPQGQILQEGYAYSSIVDKLAGEGAVIGEANLKRIDSTNADPLQSYLWRKISGMGTINGSTMPPSSQNRVLSDEQKNTIRLWIVQGAKQN